ncbi:hypothetical protein DET49_10145 [Salegentibacter sp. 24]|uniref:cupin domain-containing protein n=1 Tax=Salegentibacter sp. 24 TaxID=2183986 RepID=UPI00105D2E31|nr:cupin domain-containing protein [Salegentibacter sp. 24]TDN95450.1 hypothetical protein DET49_10145 [Salegentibacter sp. 24]
MNDLKTKKKIFFKEADTSWETIDKGIQRQLVNYNSQIMQVKVRFEKGAIGYEHSHFHTQSTYVTSGKFEVVIDGKRETLLEGDGFLVPPNIKHGVKCLEAGVLIDVFSPLREDILLQTSHKID